MMRTSVLLCFVLALAGAFSLSARTVSVEVLPRTANVTVENEANGVLFKLVGPADLGETKEGWTKVEKVADVGIGTQTIRVDLSADVGSVVRFILEDDGAEYPADIVPVDYIDSTGREYIDTGYVGQYGDTYRAKFRYLSLAGGDDHALIGAYGVSGNGRYCPILARYNAGFDHVVYFNDRWASGKRGISVVAGTDYFAEAVFVAGEQKLSVGSSFDSLSLSESEDIADAVVNNAPLTIFGRNKAYEGKVDSMSHARLYSLTIAHEGQLVRDFVPCVSNGTAVGLWDRVGKAFYGNGSGKGGLVAGSPTTSAPAVYSDAIVSREILVSPIRGSIDILTGFDIAAEGPASLLMLSGPTDAGARDEDWSHVTDLGTVGNGVTHLHVDLPDDLKYHDRFFRFKVAAMTFPDGVREVEYVESTGSQYVDTGYVGQYGDTYRAKFRYLSLGAGDDHVLIGAYGVSGNGRYCPILARTSGFGFDHVVYFNDRWAYGKSGISAVAENDYCAEAVFVAGEQKLSVGSSFDSLSLSESENVADAVVNTAPLTIFGRNKAFEGKVDSLAHARLYSLSIAHDGQPVRDFIPCKSGQAGALYDRITGLVYTDSTGTGLVAGPEVEPPAPIYSEVVENALLQPTVEVRQLEASFEDAVFSLCATLAAGASLRVGVAAGAEGDDPATEELVASLPSDNWTGEWTVRGLEADTAYRYLVKVVDGGTVVCSTSGVFRTQRAGGAIRSVEPILGFGGVTNALRVVVNAGARSGSVLLAAWDDADRGSVLARWSNVAEIAAVGEDGGEWTWTFPAAMLGKRTYVRFFVAVKNGDPPDYIASSGSEYIDTGCIGRCGDVYRMKFRYIGFFDGQVDSIMLGAYSGAAPSANRRCVPIYVQTRRDFVFTLNEKWFNDGAGQVKATVDTDYFVETVFSEEEQRISVGDSFDNLTVSATAKVTMPVANVDAPLYLFARNCGNAGTDGRSKAWLYFCTIERDGKLIRDFVPHVSGAEVGLYDRVEGRFYGNASGIGGFTTSSSAMMPYDEYACSYSGVYVGERPDLSELNAAKTAVTANGCKILASGELSRLGVGRTRVGIDWGFSEDDMGNRVSGPVFQAQDVSAPRLFEIPAKIYGKSGLKPVYCRLFCRNELTNDRGEVESFEESHSAVFRVMVNPCPNGMVLILK